MSADIVRTCKQVLGRHFMHGVPHPPKSAKSLI
jgi:hypothetical protein